LIFLLLICRTNSAAAQVLDSSIENGVTYDYALPYPQKKKMITLV
jgi:hypothetical protein